MSPIGPTLPPHLTSKRKWSEEELRDSEQKHRSRSSSIENGEKRRKILGPAPPPAPINERPMEPAGKIESKEDSDSDDDFGPALASNSETADVSQTFTENMQNLADTDGPPARSLQREEWMLAPPSQGDWTSRIDPTKLKNRRFNTGKGARAPNQILQPENTLWTETPEQKRRRLQDEVMGVAQPKPVDGPVSQSAKSQGQAIDTRRKVQEYNVRSFLSYNWPLLI